MNSIMAFLVIVLIAGLLLMAVMQKGGNHRRGRRRSAKPVRGGYQPSIRSLDKTELATRWATILATSNSGAAGLKSSINEADKLLDHVMRQQGANGDTMGERLKSFGSRFSDRNGIWRAHKLRNVLAHEVGFDLVPSQAKEALRDFERGLKDLGAL
jgi:hypothetical protein